MTRKQLAVIDKLSSIERLMRLNDPISGATMRDSIAFITDEFESTSKKAVKQELERMRLGLLLVMKCVLSLEGVNSPNDLRNTLLSEYRRLLISRAPKPKS